MKKIIIIFLVCLLVYIIYELFLDKKTKYLYIGNTNYSRYNLIIKENYNPKEYIEYNRDDDYRVIDLMNEISENKQINKRGIQNLLVKSNVMVISIGKNDLETKKELNYNYIDELLEDIDKLLKTIRKYNKDKIYFLGFYNKNSYYDYMINKVKLICEKNGVIYIDIEIPIYKQLY